MKRKSFFLWWICCFVSQLQSIDVLSPIKKTFVPVNHDQRQKKSLSRKKNTHSLGEKSFHKISKKISNKTPKVSSKNSSKKKSSASFPQQSSQDNLFLEEKEKKLTKKKKTSSSGSKMSLGSSQDSKKSNSSLSFVGEKKVAQKTIKPQKKRQRMIFVQYPEDIEAIKIETMKKIPKKNLTKKITKKKSKESMAPKEKKSLKSSSFSTMTTPRFYHSPSFGAPSSSCFQPPAYPPVYYPPHYSSNYYHQLPYVPPPLGAMGHNDHQGQEFYVDPMNPFSYIFYNTLPLRSPQYSPVFFAPPANRGEFYKSHDYYDPHNNSRSSQTYDQKDSFFYPETTEKKQKKTTKKKFKKKK